MGKAAGTIALTAVERTELEGLAGRRTAQGLARRARIVLAAADGLENKAIAQAFDADENTVGKWRRRFGERRIDGLYDEPRSGAPRRIGDDEIADDPSDAGDDPTGCDALVAALDGCGGGSRAVDDPPHWKAFGLQPHRVETFKLSGDPCSWRRCATSSGSTWLPPSTP
jgi:hypothetical protein